MAVATYRKELLMFDVIGELSATGVEAAKHRLTEWFSTMQELVDYEVNIIDLTAGTDVAFCNTFNHIIAIKRDGGQLDMWWRETLGWKKQDDEWHIASAHSSVPFDGQSGKASIDLKP